MCNHAHVTDARRTAVKWFLHSAGGALGARHMRADRDGITPMGFASSHGFADVAAALTKRLAQLEPLEQSINIAMHMGGGSMPGASKRGDESVLEGEGGIE